MRSGASFAFSSCLSLFFVTLIDSGLALPSTFETVRTKRYAKPIWLLNASAGQVMGSIVHFCSLVGCTAEQMGSSRLADRIAADESERAQSQLVGRSRFKFKAVIRA